MHRIIRIIHAAIALTLTTVHGVGLSQIQLAPSLRDAPSNVTSVLMTVLPEFTPPSLPFREPDLKRVGCKIAVTDKKTIKSLIDVLAEADIRMDGASVQEDLRFSVELQRADGSTTTLLFNDVRRDGKGRVHGSLGGQHATASSSLPAALRGWAKNMLPPGTASGLRGCSWRAFVPSQDRQLAAGKFAALSHMSGAVQKRGRRGLTAIRSS